MILLALKIGISDEKGENVRTAAAVLPTPSSAFKNTNSRLKKQIFEILKKVMGCLF